jgi:hypothetical protein
MKASADLVGVDSRVFDTLTGTIFEVRQGYKSKDSKRQNADIASLSLGGIITGHVGINDPLRSTYDFMKDVVGYDLAAFFQRNSDVLKAEIDLVLRALLAPETT